MAYGGEKEKDEEFGLISSLELPNALILLASRDKT